MNAANTYYQFDRLVAELKNKVNVIEMVINLFTLSSLPFSLLLFFLLQAMVVLPKSVVRRRH